MHLMRYDDRKNNPPRKTPAAEDRRAMASLFNIMKITVSADHRIVDGAMAAAFANCIRAKLEDASLWDSLI